MTPGAHMAAEIAEAPGVFDRALGQKVPAVTMPRAFYTIARGSSDAAANILSYAFMRATGRAMTSLPPSIFSLGRGVDLQNTCVVIISQSGASEDLVTSARGAKAAGAQVIAIVNETLSPVAAEADLTLPIGAGPELAVPATKSVVGAVGAGLALLGALTGTVETAVLAGLTGRELPDQARLVAALLRARHVYVIGRDTGYGAAQELALKIKETCALHAEAYSSSEVLHGPLQLATNPLLVLILDTELADIQPSLDTAEARLKAAGGTVFRIMPSACGAQGLSPAAAAAALLILTYPLVLAVARALGHDPDRPQMLSKVTQTR